jgi:hypothetical protein
MRSALPTRRFIQNVLCWALSGCRPGTALTAYVWHGFCPTLHHRGEAGHARTQHYREDRTVLHTHWMLDAGTLLLTDAMLWPEDHRLFSHTEYVRARLTLSKLLSRGDERPGRHVSSMWLHSRP